MSEDKENDLLDFLDSRGFKRAQMESQVRELSKVVKQEAVLHYTEAFGLETIFFKLYLEWDLQFDAYRLNQYTATHRKVVPVRHAVINDVDTKVLEARMTIEDWGAYFRGEHSNLNEHDKVYIQETLSLLDNLSNDLNFDGMQVQESLMFKYWPSEYYDHPSKSGFQMLYEQSREFVPTNLSVGNLNLAYYLVSGKLNELYESLQKMEADDFVGTDLYTVIKYHLQQGSKSFDVFGCCNQNEGYVEFKLNVTNIAYELTAETYKLTLWLHPTIDHGVYNDIDTEQLEILMRKINWRDSDAIYSVDEDRTPELVYTSDMIEVTRQMEELRLSKEGANVVMQLQSKYYRSNDFLNEVFADVLDKSLPGLPIKEYEFAADVPVKAAFNLLCGRAVQENIIHSFYLNNDNWVRLDLKKEEPIVEVASFNPDELENQIGMLPIWSAGYDNILDPLVQGALVNAILKNGSEVVLEANPENKTINVYTLDMELIPLNLSFDPNWKPDLHEKQTDQQRLLKCRTKNKGLGI